MSFPGTFLLPSVYLLSSRLSATIQSGHSTQPHFMDLTHQLQNVQLLAVGIRLGVSSWRAWIKWAISSLDRAWWAANFDSGEELRLSHITWATLYWSIERLQAEPTSEPQAHRDNVLLYIEAVRALKSPGSSLSISSRSLP
ncbi:hypothetical protein K438DRAFT_1756200 [Mycena galopus ATCC 62051]|nr:hypothetical protein K438DRAFT_1756200 [Mycena galopus ATCC 62051]